MRNTFRFPANKIWAVFGGAAYLFGSFLPNGLHLHADWHSPHDDGQRHHIHIVLHGHSDLAAQPPHCAKITPEEKDHHHPLGECQESKFFQVLSKRSRPSESKKTGFEPLFAAVPFPQLFLPGLRTTLLAGCNPPPREIFLPASSGRSPPLG